MPCFSSIIVIGKVVLHLNIAVISRCVFYACSVHFLLLSCIFSITVIAVVPFFQRENRYIKITTPLHILSHEMGMVNDISIGGSRATT